MPRHPAVEVDQYVDPLPVDPISGSKRAGSRQILQ
jgi:hypothetical protein